MLSIVKGNGPQPPENTQLWACASRLQDYKTGEGLLVVLAVHYCLNAVMFTCQASQATALKQSHCKKGVSVPHTNACMTCSSMQYGHVQLPCYLQWSVLCGLQVGQ